MASTTLDPALWRDLLGLPFRHRGRGPDAYDCYGLMLEIYRRQGVAVFDPAYAESDLDQARAFRANLHRWQRCEPEPGAVLLFRRGNLANHVGIMLDHERLIHATAQFGQVKLDYLTRGVPPLAALLLGAYRPCP